MPLPATFECFGLVIHGFGWPEVRLRLEDACSRGEPLWILTANPEILLTAKRRPEYWQTLRQTDLRLVDGVGLQYIGRLFRAAPVRLSGVDLAENILEHAEVRGWRVAFVGGAVGVADRAAWNIRRRYPTLRIIAEHGGVIDDRGEGDAAAEEAAHRLTLESPEVLLVAFGHPKQEAWIRRRMTEFPSVRVVVGVGGTFDYWAETHVRAPHWMRRIGLEWVWRLFCEPKRWKRIIDAVLFFPVLAIRDRWFR